MKEAFMRTVLLVILVFLVSLLCPVLADDPPKTPVNDTTTAEAELGKQTAAQIEKQYKLVKDDAMVKKLSAMAAEIAPVTQRPGVVYTCKILDLDALNAMAIPGGTIYFTKGLLKAVESDHELAGVMAHEIAHNALRHAVKLASREGKISMVQIATIIASIYANQDGDIPTGQIIALSEVMKEALINGYSVELEAQADENGLEYLAKTKKYNPIGLYSVILGLRQIENRHAFVEMGYLKTHPYSDERKSLIEDKLKELGIPINLWPVVSFRASSAGDEKTGYTVKLGTTALVTLTQADGADGAKARADAAATAINRRLMRDYVQQLDIDSDRDGANILIRLRGITVLTLTPADAAAASMTPDAFGAMVVQKLKTAFWTEAVKRS
jgi:hypothetical protein